MLNHYDLSLYVGWFEIPRDFIGLPELYGLKCENLITLVIVFVLVLYNLDGSMTCTLLWHGYTQRLRKFLATATLSSRYHGSSVISSSTWPVSSGHSFQATLFSRMYPTLHSVLLSGSSQM
jgi:hypothetical protein